MAAPGTINFRVIADDYYAIVPEGTDPTSSEMRRGYLQFVIDPLVIKFNKEIAAHRDQVKLLIDARTKEGADVFARRVCGDVAIDGRRRRRAL